MSARDQDDGYECRLCAAEDSNIEAYVRLGGEDLCGRCGERIANAWWKKHSGRWLTYPNEPASPGYRKISIPEELRWQVFERDGFACRACGSRRFLRADHVIPESRGGPAEIGNLQTLCMYCNSKKGSSLKTVKTMVSAL